MANTFIFSDLHIRKDVFSGTKNSKAVCDFLVNQLPETADYIIFGGDFWHDRKVISPECIHLGFEFVQQLLRKAPNSRLLFTIGNHDLAGTEHTTFYALKALATLSDRIACYENPVYKFCTNTGNLLDIYTLKDNAFPILSKDYKLVGVWHSDIKGYEFPGYIQPEGLELEQYIPNLDLILLGHYHNKRSLQHKVMYLGGVQALTANDANTEKSCYLADSNSFKLQEINITKCLGNEVISYIKIQDIADLETMDVTNSVVSLTSEVVSCFTTEERKQVLEHLRSKGALQIKLASANTSREEIVLTTLKQEDSISIDVKLDKIQEEFVDITSKNLTNVDKEEIIKARKEKGKELLSKIVR